MRHSPLHDARFVKRKIGRRNGYVAVIGCGIFNGLVENFHALARVGGNQNMDRPIGVQPFENFMGQ